MERATVTMFTGTPAVPLRPKLSRDDLIQGGGLAVLAFLLAGAVFLPLYAMLSKSFQDADAGSTITVNISVRQRW